MQHSFEIGGKYRNRKGEYEVIGLEGSKMVLRYLDGTVVESPIAIQERIRRNIQREELEKPPQSSHVRNPKRSISISKPAMSIGLTDDDFKKGVAGTCWRRRTGFAGLIAQHLTDATSRNFESYAIYRKATVHIADPVFYGFKTKWREAKFMFELDTDTARYGFYIEKNNGPMDIMWHWPNFMAYLERNSGGLDSIETAMDRFGLVWSVYVWDDGGLIAEVKISQGKLVCEDRKRGTQEPLSWSGFHELLTSIEAEKWCDLTLSAYMPKDPAVAAGTQLVDRVVEVYAALLSLYEASTGGFYAK